MLQGGVLKMINAANLLTMLRIAIVPFFVMSIKFENSQFFKLVALALFVIACLTDAVDGIIARKFNLITNFGKFLDPLADKILVSAAMVCFVELKLLNSTYLIIILFREFLVTSLRLCLALNQKVVAANFLGKLKTVLQISAIILILCSHSFALGEVFKAFTNFSIIVATIATVVSGATYLIQNFKYITTTN